MSAKIHTVTAAAFKGEMSASEREKFLAEVASEFLAKTGRGKNRHTIVSMPDSYAALYGRRLRQAAKLADKPLTDVEAKVIEHAEAVAAKAEPKTPTSVKARAPRKPRAKAEPAATEPAKESEPANA